MSSTCGSGAGVIACADVEIDKAKPAMAINLSIVSSLGYPIDRTSTAHTDGSAKS
jgi:hypothetical protein